MISSITPTPLRDLRDTALCLWREARGEGEAGMTAVACVIRNRVAQRGSSFKTEVYRPRQFTSMSVESDPEYGLLPLGTDQSWHLALDIAEGVIDDQIPDVTGCSTLYWNPRGIKSTKLFTLNDGRRVAFPRTWNPAAVREAAVIGHHVFLTEVQA